VHPHSTILQIVTGNPPSALSQNYTTVLHLFDTVKKQLYSPDQAFLDPDILGFKELPERKVIRKANLATFISSVFGSVDVGFFHLNEGFLNTFAPDSGRLLKDISKLLLDLKTQVTLISLESPHGLTVRHISLQWVNRLVIKIRF
jgi:protein TBF1